MKLRFLKAIPMLAIMALPFVATSCDDEDNTIDETTKTIKSVDSYVGISLSEDFFDVCDVTVVTFDKNNNSNVVAVTKENSQKGSVGDVTYYTYIYEQTGVPPFSYGMYVQFSAKESPELSDSKTTYKFSYIDASYTEANYSDGTTTKLSSPVSGSSTLSVKAADLSKFLDENYLSTLAHSIAVSIDDKGQVETISYNPNN